MTKNIIAVFLICIGVQGFSQSPLDKVRDYTKSHQGEWLKHYMEFVSLPNVSRDTPNIRRNAAFIQQWMQSLGIESQLLDGITPGVTPAVYGKVTAPGAKRTLAFYAHYDGQPVNPKQWAPGLDPFTPVFLTNPIERGGQIVSVDLAKGQLPDNYRLSGRGSADDKAGVMTILHAYEALLRSAVKLNNNIIFFFEGEEEIGSIHIAEIFEKHRSKLQADVWLIADGPRHVSGRRVVQFGVRGDVNMALTVYGAKRPLHSGNYGNWAPNPARMLVELLAGMKDATGRVTIPGFYEDVIPLSEEEKKAIAAIPDIENTLKQELGVLEPEGGGKAFLELLHLPTLNINGIQSANVGAMAANIIPVKAEAVIDLRLVLGNDVKRQISKVVRYIESKGFKVLDHDPTEEERKQFPRLIKITHEEGYNAQRTPMNLPIAGEILAAIQGTSREPVIALPSAGGSLPLIVFEQKLGAKVITIPVVNYDNNQHAENENILIRYLWEGVEMMAALMSMK